MEYEIGDVVLEMPDGMTPEQTKAAIAKFRTTPEFDLMVDKKTGAPARVRSLVGSAPEQDRLANLKRFYPDAVPYGEDNFVFTDPASGRPTLYNETKGGVLGSGLTMGDAASVAREATEAVGGTLGAAAGALAGATGGPAAPATIPAGAIAGAGAGTAAGGALFDAYADTFMGRIDTRTVPERLGDTALDFSAGALGQKGGELLEKGVQAVVGGGTQAAKALADKFMALGVRPEAAAVSGSKLVGTTKKMLESTVGAETLEREAKAVLDSVSATAERITTQFGEAKTVQGAGEVIQQAATAAAERFGFRQAKLYDEAYSLIGPDTPVAVIAVKALREEMEEELARAPRALEPALKSAMGMLREIELDAAGGGIAFDALRQVRTMIGRDIAEPLLAGSTGSQNEALKRIYAALTLDLGEAAKAAGPEAAKKMATADRYTRFFMSTAKETMQKLANFDGPERAFRFALQSSRDGGTALARMRRHFTEEEWDTVTAAVIERMGKALPSAQDAGGDVFSVSTFMTNWNKLAPEAKAALFGGKRYADMRASLDTFAEVVSSLKGVEKLTNTSNTARQMIAYSTMSVLGSSLGAIIGGDVQSAGGGGLAALGGTVLAPRYAAKLLTSPKFVKWLTTPVTDASKIPAHLGRLVAIGEAEPELQEAIQQYVTALRPVPKAVQ